MCTRWDFTVASESMSSCPISRFEEPAATRVSTSSSRGVSDVRGVRTLVINRSATTGESAESPSAAERTAARSSAGGASLSMYPTAPASMAPRMSASVS